MVIYELVTLKILNFDPIVRNVKMPYDFNKETPKLFKNLVYKVGI